MTWMAESPAITLTVTQKHKKVCSQLTLYACVLVFFRKNGGNNWIRNLAVGKRLCLLTDMNEKNKYLGLPRSKEKRQLWLES